MAQIPSGWELIPKPAPKLPAFDLGAAVDFGKRWGTVTSAARSPEHNRDVGGVGNSWHLTTQPSGPRAVDIQRGRGVRHSDIVAGYRNAGFDLMEAKDEGDHSHLAFRSGPPRASVQAGVPTGWEAVPSQQQRPAPRAASATPRSAPAPIADRVAPGGIEGMVRRSVGAPPAPPKRTWKDRLYMFGGDVAAGAGDLLDMLKTAGPVGGAQHLATAVTGPWQERDIYNAVAKAKGKAFADAHRQEIHEAVYGKPFGQRFRQATGAPEPVTRGERIGSAVTRGATAGLLTGGTSAIGQGGNVARTILIDTVAGGTSGAGAEIGYEKGGQPGAIIGGIVGGGVGLAGASRVGRGRAPRVEAPAGRPAAPVTRPVVSRTVEPVAAPEIPAGWEPVTSPSPTRAKTMASAVETPTLVGPAERVVDRIDIGNIPPGWVPVADPVIGRTRVMGEQATAQEIAASANRVSPEDVTPIPHNAVESLEEFNRIGDPRPALTPPNPADELSMRTVGSRSRRGPLDLVSWVRSQPWALKDEAGELSQYGITNAPRRDLDFAKDEGFLGRLVDNEKGVPLDDAAQAAWEAGYFPNLSERPTIPEFLETLSDTHRGGNRAFRPEDLDEVARYNAARADADTIRSANDQGVTLAEDISQPVEMGDLAANEPPPSAYEDLVRVGGKVSNINLAKIETRHDIRRALQNVEANFGGFDAARRGVITQEQTAALASELKMRPEDLLKRRKGQALNAEQALAARQILAKSSDELVALAGKAKGGSDAELLAFRKGLIRHAAIQEQVTGATAEAGRALAQFRMMARSKAVPGRVLESMVEGSGGREGIEDAAQAILDFQKNPSKLNAFVRTAANPRLRDKFSELYINGLLSNPATHVVNSVSNALTALAQPVEHAVAAAIGAGRRALRLGAPDRVTFSEVGSRAVGLMSAIPDGLKEAGRVFRTELPRDWITKIETQGTQNIKGTKGRLIRIPTRALTAADEVFKAIARESSVRGLAVRKAYAEGLRGDALKARAADLAANPTDEIIEQAFDYARYVTFQSKVGPLASGLMRAANETQILHFPVLKTIFPFVRTPTNLLKFAIERSPFAPVLKRWREDYRAGGALRDLAISKAVVGSGFGYMVYQLAQSGIITGSGPADPNAKKLLMANGWQPYSIKIGDDYYSYQRMDPFATTFGIAADFGAKFDYMTDKQRDDAVVILTTSILQQMEDKTWLSGVSDLMKALDDPQRFGETFLAGQAGGFVPAVVGNTAALFDPVQRDTRHTEGLTDYLGAPLARVRSRIPGLSDALPERVDMWGRTLPNDRTRLISPFRTSEARHDPITEEMLRINARFGQLKNETDGLPHTPAQQSAYEALAGRYTYEDIGKAMADPSWLNLSDDERRKWVDEIKEDARRAARRELGLGQMALPPGWEQIPAGWQATQ